METQAGKNFDPDIVEIASDQNKESSEFDRLANYELFYTRLEKIQEDIEDLKAERKFKENIHKWRKYGLISLFALIVGWLFIICVFLVVSGFDPCAYPIVKLSDPVLIALISTTTVNVLMLLLVAARWLYDNPKSEKNR